MIILSSIGYSFTKFDTIRPVDAKSLYLVCMLQNGRELHIKRNWYSQLDVCRFWRSTRIRRLQRDHAGSYRNTDHHFGRIVSGDTVLGQGLAGAGKNSHHQPASRSTVCVVCTCSGTLSRFNTVHY